MEQAPCPGCGNPVEFEPVFHIGTQTIAPFCDICEAKHREEFSRQDRDLFVARHWKSLCPSRFQDTEFSKLPHPDKSTKAMVHTFKDGLGLNLWGKPDTGKTRTMFLILKKLHAKGLSLAVYTANDLAAEIERRGFSRNIWAHNVSRRDILAIDDMDKLHLTKPQEATFFGLLDKRMSHCRPCVFTHNSSAEELEYKFRNGAALVRRIRQFTVALHFP
jgi:DNA replication protein DnaC